MRTPCPKSHRVSRAPWLPALLAAALLAAPAGAWGPDGETTIVTNAAHLMSRQGTIPLANLERDVRGGASIPQNLLYELVPMAADNLPAAIENEMRLLQTVRGDRVDPYFAYRLGVLGKLVARATAPMRDAPSTLRDQYYSDASGNLNGVNLQARPRQVVEPQSYLPERMQAAAVRDDLLEQDYRAGLGFDGVARSALGEDASRSLNAVADVWHTVVTGPTIGSPVSLGQQRDYMLTSLEFYVFRGNTNEINRAYERFTDLGLRTAEARIQIAEMFYEAGMEERAMDEYRGVLAESPDRRDVAQRVANHYIEVGQAALDAENLTDARDAFAEAAEADQLNDQAQSLLLDAEREIEARNARLEAALDAVSEGDERLSQAENRAEAGNYAEAIDLLRTARARFESVDNEFPEAVRRAQLGLNNLSIRMRQYQERLVASASDLSGAGSAIDSRRLAEISTVDLDEEALQKLIAARFEALSEQLREEVDAELNQR